MIDINERHDSNGKKSIKTFVCFESNLKEEYSSSTLWIDLNCYYECFKFDARDFS